MTRIVFHVDPTSIPAESSDDTVHCQLYGASPPRPGVGVVGAKCLRLAHRLGLVPSAASMDLLTVAMAVTAADTFSSRSAADNGWTRDLRLTLPVAEPKRWRDLERELAKLLRFLSSDNWSFDFKAGGVKPPFKSELQLLKIAADVSKADCVALFSGGLDSAVGAIELIEARKRPILVGHAAHGDGKYQGEVAALLPNGFQRIAVNSYPTGAEVDDDSMRTRSFQFLSLGVLVASAVASYRRSDGFDLFVCENGLIALNPPLTPRRTGSLSTRTAHPNFLAGMQGLVSALGIPVQISNPYKHDTKGEMLLRIVGTQHEPLASKTVSCGKWKRGHQQCGRCVPCIIRRASFHASGLADQTIYESTDLKAVLPNEDLRDDLLAVQSAVLRLREGALARWVSQSGPLPTGGDRGKYVDVASRGLKEIEAFLASQKVAP